MTPVNAIDDPGEMQYRYERDQRIQIELRKMRERGFDIDAQAFHITRNTTTIYSEWDMEESYQFDLYEYVIKYDVFIVDTDPDEGGEWKDTHYFHPAIFEEHGPALVAMLMQHYSED